MISSRISTTSVILSASLQRSLTADDILVINGEISHVSEITDGLPCHIITYGLKPECDYAAENITFDEFAKGSS